jgi:hypothetical protein
MDVADTLRALVADPELHARIDSAQRAHRAAFRHEMRFGARRALVQDGLDCDVAGTRIRSLWLLSQRGLRRGGVRRHPESSVVLVATYGTGLVLLRAEGARRSMTLVPLDAASHTEGERWVVVEAGMPYDTLADETSWHVLALHSHPATGLRRQDETPDGWVEKLEEADS